jgi:uncharacterized membrane protein YkgB
VTSIRFRQDGQLSWLFVSERSNSSTNAHAVDGVRDQERSKAMNTLIHILTKSGLLTKDLDYQWCFFLAFGYQKWFAYEAQVLIPYISNGPLIFWMYTLSSASAGASWFLGVSEWLIGALLFLGFWNKRLGILGAIGSTGTFVMTVTIITFMPNGGIRLPNFRRWPATFLS